MLHTDAALAQLCVGVASAADAGTGGGGRGGVKERKKKGIKLHFLRQKTNKEI